MLYTSIQRLSAYTSLSKRLRWMVRAVRQSYDSICGKKRYNSQLGKFFLQIFPNWELLIIFVSTNISNMRLTGSEKLENLCRKYSEARPAIERWVDIISSAQWKNHAELKNDFLSADFVGNDRYVFNIKGNKYRLVVVVVFAFGRANIRFAGTHKEYDKIKDIKNI